LCCGWWFGSHQSLSIVTIIFFIRRFSIVKSIFKVSMGFRREGILVQQAAACG
jgi:hypothetical protein